MTSPSWTMMIVVMVVTFIAGYSAISYVVKKFRAARDEPEKPSDQITDPKNR